VLGAVETAADVRRSRVRRPIPRSQSADRGGWWAAAIVCGAVALIGLPVAVVAASVLTPDLAVWSQLWATRLPAMLASTAALMAAVGAGTLVLGASLAWLVSAYDFPGRRVFAWALLLPLAMPAYVLGFVFVSELSYPGPVQAALRGLFGPGVWFPQVRSLAGAATVLSLTLYPYVYLLARAAYTEQAAATFEAARTLGQGRVRAARRVVLPLARPSLAAGLTLVLMEVLTDFATVQYFNVETVSVGIYRVWKGMFDRAAASELAALVLLVALAVIAIERLLRRRARYHQHGGAAQGLSRARLRGRRGWAATGVCAAVLAFAFVGPVARLVSWIGADTVRGVAGAVDTRYITYLGNSLLVAVLAAIGCVCVAVAVTTAARLHGGRLTRLLAPATTVGYAVPGPVVAIGVLLVLAGADRAVGALGLPFGKGLLVTGSIVGLVYAYVVRFAALSYSGVDASLSKVTPSMTMAARSLGAGGRRILWRVHLPLIRSGVVVAGVLVVLEAAKELPIVLLLRPFGFETLSVWVWQLASESRWEAAGLPALTIVAAALVPVVLLARAGGPLGHASASSGPRAADPAPSFEGGGRQ
jgi:iron(III) transport system permease protein